MSLVYIRDFLPHVAANNDKALLQPSGHVTQKIWQQILGTQFLPKKKQEHWARSSGRARNILEGRHGDEQG